MSTRCKGRTVGVPRGLLRFLVLKMLSEKPMSGTEIIEAIKMQTGSWKPSPGSIYPLLAWMLKKGFTKELPKDELGVKRYSVTEEGNRFLEIRIITVIEEGFLFAAGNNVVSVRRIRHVPYNLGVAASFYCYSFINDSSRNGFLAIETLELVCAVLGCLNKAVYEHRSPGVAFAGPWSRSNLR